MKEPKEMTVAEIELRLIELHEERSLIKGAIVGVLPTKLSRTELEENLLELDVSIVIGSEMLADAYSDL